MSVQSFNSVTIKEEIQDDSISLFNASTVIPDQSNFDNMSVTGGSSIGTIVIEQNLMNWPPNPFENRMPCDEKTPKKEEKPVVLRNTGKISVENYRQRRLFSNRNSSQNRYSSGNGLLSPNNQWSTPVTTELIIEPNLPHTPNSILVATQTSQTSNEPDVIELSDGEEENNNNEEPDQKQEQQEQQVQQPEQAPSPLAQITPALLARLRDYVQQNVNIQNGPLNNTIDTSVHCSVCNQRYKTRNTFNSHTKTAKHQNNLRASQQSN